MFKTITTIAKLCKFMFWTSYAKLFYSRNHFFSDLFLRLNNFNLILVKILQCSSNNSLLWSQENRELLKQYTDRVPYSNADIDYQTIYSLRNNKQVIFNNYEKPIHSGTISLVYDGIYKNKKVIIKIKRKNIEQRLRKNNEELKSILFIFKWIPIVNKLQIEDSYNIYKPLLETQCDFQNEISNQERYRNNFKNHKSIKVPIIYNEACTNNSITMEYVNGFNISQIQPQDKDAFMKIMGDIIVNSIIVYGFFHCDQHAGNIIFMKENGHHKICAIDFGICGNHTSDEINNNIDLFTCISNSDYNQTTTLFLRNFTNCKETHKYYIEIFEQCRSLLYNSFENTKEFSFYEIYTLYKILKKYNLKTNECWMKTELAIAAIDSCMKELKHNDIGLTDILKQKVRQFNELQNCDLLN